MLIRAICLEWMFATMMLGWIDLQFESVESCILRTPRCAPTPILQGVPQFPPQLCLLISRSYVNMTKYPFNHVISEAWEFFCGMKHHGICKDALEKRHIEF